MIKNYILVAWRNLWKHRFFAIVNISGLAVGLTFVLLIGAYVWGELRVNRFVPDNDRIFLLKSKWKNPDTGAEFATLGPLTESLKESYPALIEKSYCHDGIISIVSVGDRHFREGIQPGDSTLLDIFQLPVVYGNSRTALEKPNAVVITEKKARQFFGRTDVVGKFLKIQSFDGRNNEFEVTAVIRDLPFNTITDYAKPGIGIFLGPASIRYFGRTPVFTNWQLPNIIGYVKLRPGVKKEQLMLPLKTLIKQNASVEIQKTLEVNPVSLKDNYIKLFDGLRVKMMIIFSFVALFILLMAIINFVNISIGNSLTRLKEIGVRKAMGSRKVQLVLQFITESVVVVTVAFIISLLMFVLLRPYFGQIIGKEIMDISYFPGWFVGVPGGIILLTGVLAGIYPAFVLSAQPSVTALRGKMRNVGGKQAFRRGLIVIQFVTAIVVFVAAIIIDRQVSFFFHTDLGYNRQGVITVPLPRDWTRDGVQHMLRMRDEFRSIPEIEEATFSYEIPDGWSGGTAMIYKPQNDSSTAVSALSIISDERYLLTYGIKMAVGNFYRGTAADSIKIVLNEAAVRALGWKTPEEALHKPVRMYNTNQEFYVEGITRDFHFGTLKNKISPIYFGPVNFQNIYRYISFRLTPGNIPAKIAGIQRKWTQIFPEVPFDFKFIDDSLAQMYETESQMQRAARVATIVTLMIVLLGVLGIVTMSIARRDREMGIRRILGASMLHVMGLFAKEFSWALIISNIVAWPLAWCLLENWLKDYAYSINMGVWPFLIVGFSLLVLVGGIILIMTHRHAAMNPVKSLRVE